MKNLKRVREKMGYTQRDVADMLQIQRPTYTRYETGERQPDCDTLRKLSKLFHCSTDYLLELTDDESDCKKALIALNELDGEKLPEDFVVRMEDNSMAPRIQAGDMITIHRQKEIANREIALLLLPNASPAVRQVTRQGSLLILTAYNPAFEPVCCWEGIRILGKVTGLQGNIS